MRAGLEAAVHRAAVVAHRAERAAQVEVGHRARDVEPRELPVERRVAALQAQFPLARLQRGHRLARVRVLRALVRHDLRFDALAPARIGEQPGLDRVAGRDPRRGDAVAVAGGARAVGADAVARQPRVPRADPGREAVVPADRVLHRQLGRALVAVGVGVGQARVGRRHRGGPDVAGADVVVGLVLEAVAHAALQQAEAQLVAHAARHHVALEVEAARGLRAALVLAAEVVHVEGAVGTVAVVVAFGAAAEGIGQPVVGLQALLADLRAPAPVGIQCLAEAHRAGQRLEHRGLRPRLVVEVDARIDRPGQRVAQQAVAVLARLLLVALLHLELEHRVACDAPVGRE
ncbi:hypothetical protein D3C71_1288200 [compost metagenome]